MGDAVITAIVSQKSGAGVTYTSGLPPAPSANLDDHYATHERDYIYDARAADHKMLELDRPVYSRGKTAKATPIIRSAHSNARATGATTTGNEFTLLHSDAKGNTGEVTMVPLRRASRFCLGKRRPRDRCLGEAMAPSGSYVFDFGVN